LPWGATEGCYFNPPGVHVDNRSWLMHGCNHATSNGVEGLRHFCRSPLSALSQHTPQAMLPGGQSNPRRYALHAMPKQRLHSSESWGRHRARQRHKAQALAEAPPPGPDFRFRTCSAARAASTARSTRSSASSSSSPNHSTASSGSPGPGSAGGAAAPPPAPAAACSLGTQRVCTMTPRRRHGCSAQRRPASAARLLQGRAASTARRLARLELPSWPPAMRASHLGAAGVGSNAASWLQVHACCSVRHAGRAPGGGAAAPCSAAPARRLAPGRPRSCSRTARGSTT